MTKASEKPHYVNNKEFSLAVVDYCEKAEKAKKQKSKKVPIVPDYIAECFLKIAEGLSHKSNFIRYTYREEMVMDAVENCLKAIKNYDIKKLWSNFKTIQLWPSLDGIGKRAEYGRKGLKWEVFVDNLEHFKNFVTTVSAVSNIYSISSLPDMIYFLKDRNINFYITNLTSPPILSTTVLPKESKQFVLNKFKQLINSNILNDSELENVKGILSFMVSKNDTSYLEQFKKYNQALDESREEAFEEIFPEYESWYRTI